MMKALQRAWALRWDHNAGFAFDAVYEVTPLIRVSLPSQAAAWHLLDCWCQQDIRPNIDIRQHPLERLTSVEGSSKIVLVLPQRQGSCSTNGVTSSITCLCFCQVSILVDLPLAVAVPPSYTDLMELIVVDFHTRLTVRGKNRVITLTKDFKTVPIIIH